MPIFNEQKLREEIIKIWGEHGAHCEVFDDLVKKNRFQNIEMFFLGQFEVYYNELEWDIEEARQKAYQNTIKHFNELPDWEFALQQFKNNYNEN